MSTYLRFSTFEDAFYFCNEAKGMPVVASTQDTLQRYLRAAVLLSWIGLEEVVRSCVQDLRSGGHVLSSLPKHLYGQVAYLLSSAGKPMVDRSEYNRFRRLRNDIAHANEWDKQLRLEVKDALASFNCCFNIASDLLPHPLRHPKYFDSYNAKLS